MNKRKKLGYLSSGLALVGGATYLALREKNEPDYVSRVKDINPKYYIVQGPLYGGVGMRGTPMFFEPVIESKLSTE